MSKIFMRFKKLISGFTASLLMFGLFAPSVAFGAITVLAVNPMLPTNDNTPTITGTIVEDLPYDAAIGVSIDNGATFPYAAVNNADGTWTVDGTAFAPGLADGTYNVVASAIDSEMSIISAMTPLVIDATAPVISSVSLSPSSGWRKIGDTVAMSIVTDGIGYANAGITLNGKGVTSFTDNGDNTYSAVYTVAEGDVDRAESDTIPVDVELTDGLGNLGSFVENHAALSSPAIDANRPIAPTVNLTSPINIGNVTTTVFRANGEAGTTVNYSIDDANAVTPAIVGSGSVNSDITIDVTSLDDGQLAAYATLTDAAGNISNPGLLNPNSTKDTVAPLAPAVTLAVVNAANVTGVLVSGNAEPNALVEYSITDGVNTVTGSGFADGFGVLDLITPTLATLLDGTVTLNATQTDAAGNESAETSQNVLKDVVLPSVLLSTATTNPTNTSDPITVLVQFSENVTGLDASDLTVTGGHVSGFLGSDKTYVFYVVLDTEGDVSISMGADVAYDVALNGNTSSNALTVDYDVTGPDAPVITSAPTINALNVGAFGITFTNNAEINATLNYVISDGVTSLSGTVSDFDNSVLVVRDLTSLSDGSVMITAYLVDEAGNPGTPSGTTLLKDTSQPAMLSIYSVPASPTNQETVTVYLGFTESVLPSALFTDISDYVTGGIASNFGPTNPTFDVWSFDLTRDELSLGSGTANVNLPANVFEDFGGNVLLAGDTLDVEFDFDAPVIASYDNAIAGTTGDVTSVTVNATDANGIEATIDYTDSLGVHSNTVVGPSGVNFEVPTDNLPAGYVGPIAYTITVCDLTNPYASRNCNAPVNGIITVTDNDTPYNLNATYLPNPATTGEDVTLSVTADDNIGTTNAEVSINGGVSVPMNGSTSPFSFTFPVPLNDDSDFTYTARVYDAEGNYADISGTIVVVDNDAPAIAGVTFNPDPATTGDDLTVNVSATDNIAPVRADITVNGTTQTVFGGSPYGYTFSGVVPLNSIAPLNWSVTVWDAAGNSDTRSGTINVTDNDAPTIDSITGTVGTTGETTTVTVNASDNIGTTAATISVNGGAFVSMTGANSPFTYGVAVPANSVADITYVIRVYDAAGNYVESAVQTITVTDNDAPILTLNGASEITLEVYSIYAEQGAIALDNVDGDISSNVVIAGDVVDTTKVGDYVVTYNVVDASGNAAQQITRMVHIVDTIPPTVTGFEVKASDGVVDLKWTNPDVSDLSGVKAYRSEISGILGAEIASVSKNQTFYSDSTVVNGRVYYYTLKVFDLGGKLSEPSVQLSASPSAPTYLYDTVTTENQNALEDKTTGEVKSGESDDNADKSEKEKQSLLPLLGLLALLVLLGTGLYLLYLQNPKWFAWMFFWRKKRQDDDK